MDNQLRADAYAAFEERDFERAANLAARAVPVGQPGSGEMAHLRGNAFMKLGRFVDAAEAYTHALRDTTYGKRGALHTNMAKAYLACDMPEVAIDQLNQALQDTTYSAAYKTYYTLGSAHLALNQAREAGIAFRKAALDQKNPNPGKALSSLGSCFMQLNRPSDAVESYRTALDFSMSEPERCHVFAQLGVALTSMSRMDEAISAFKQALDGDCYQLSAPAQNAYNTALTVMQARRQVASGAGSTNDYLAMVDPLDPTGSTGNIMPSPEDTGFFTITEPEMKKISKAQVKAERKHNHTGLKVFLFFLLLLILAGACAGFAYYKGFGFPPTEDTIKQYIEKKSDGQQTDSYWASNIASSNKRTIQERQVGKAQSVEVLGIDRSMFENKAFVRVTLAEGGSVYYTFDLVRDLLGFKITNIELYHDSYDPHTAKPTVDSTAAQPAPAQQTSTTPANESNGVDSSADQHQPGSTQDSAHQDANANNGGSTSSTTNEGQSN